MRTDAAAGPALSDGGSTPAEDHAPSGTESHPLRTAVLTVGAVLGLATAQLFYQAGAPSYRTVWAEDGQVFFYQAVHKGLAAIATPYGGYIQVLPRLLAIPGTWLPVSSLATYLAIAAVLTTSLLAVSLYWLTDQVIPSRLLRAALVVAVALHPVLAPETLGNITNVNWIIAFALFFALLRKPDTTRAIALGVAIAFLGATSTTVTVIYVPVAAYVLWTRRDRGTQLVVGAYGLGLALQAINYLKTTQPGATSPTVNLWRLYIARVLGSVAVGDHWASQLWTGGQWKRLLPFVLLAVLMVAGLLALTRGRPLLLATTCLVYSVVSFVAPLEVRGDIGLQLPKAWNGNGTRYDVLGVLFMLAAVFILLGSARLAPRARQFLTVLVVLQLVVVIAFAYRFDNGRSTGPEWGPRLAAARAECRTSHRPVVNVRITPGGVFEVQLSCHDL